MTDQIETVVILGASGTKGSLAGGVIAQHGIKVYFLSRTCHVFRKITDSADDKYVLPMTRKAIMDAYARAGIEDCWQLDAIETHDCFTTSEYMAIDHFGLTEPGQSWKAIEDGTIEMTGKLPINPSGGLIGCGHPVGATGTRQLLDAYKQAAGTAGNYQVTNAKKIATLNIGGTATTNVCFIVGI